MKKVFLPLALIPTLLLGACNKNNNSSSEESSISQSESSSSESSSQEESNGVFEYVLYAAQKYNKTLTAESLKEKSGVGPSSKTTMGNLFCLLKAGFEGFMPPITGQRRYGGDFSIHGINPSASAKEKEAFNYLQTYGLITDTGNTIMNANKDDAKAYLKRIHAYIGGSEVDDFAATVNNEWLFNDPKDQDITANDDYRTTHVVDGDKMYDNAITLIEEASETSSYNSLSNILSYLDSSYSIDDNSNSHAFINAIDAATSPSQIYNLEKDLYAQSGYSNYISRYQDGFLTAGSHFAGAFIFDEEDIFNKLLLKCENKFSSFLKNKDVKSVFETYENELTTLFGMSEEDATSLLDTYKGYLQDFGTFMSDNDYTVKGSYYGYGESDDIWKEATDNAYSIYGIFATDDLKPNAVYLSDCNYYASYYTGDLFNSDSNMNTLKAISKIHYVHHAAKMYNSVANGVKQSTVTKYSGYLATDYYQTTDNYTSNVNAAVSLFDDLISSLKSNAVTNGWLSNDGVEALKEKANAVTHSMFAEYEDIDFDFGAYFENDIPTDLFAIDQNYNLSLNKLYTDFLNKNADGTLSNGAVITLHMEPFTANAFYSQYTNSITITMGYLFSVGNLASLSKEELLATFGLVMGHEITHGFDSNGCKYTKDGKYVKSSIFPEDDLNKFKEKQQQVINLYTYEVLPGIMQSGITTLSEDLADIGGLGLITTIGLSESDFDWAELYRQIALHFMSKTTRATYDAKLKTDVHAYGEARCNPLLMSSARFNRTFNIQPDDGMYFDPAQEIVIW